MNEQHLELEHMKEVALIAGLPECLSPKAKDALTVYDSLPSFIPALTGLCSALKTAST